jgi:hypothetical protein
MESADFASDMDLDPGERKWLQAGVPPKDLEMGFL